MGQVLIFTFFLIGFGLVSTYQVGNDPFTREEPLDPEGKYLLQWHIDWNSKRITFKTTVETKGWVGFGISNNGTVEAGADFVIGGVRDNGKTYFSDRHIPIGTTRPARDRSQDWTLESGYETRTHTVLTFSRPFDTCDEQDFKLTLNTLTLIWNYGNRDDEDGQGSPSNSGIYQSNLLDPEYAPEIVRSPGRDATPTLVTKGRNENIPRNTKVWSVWKRWTLERNDTSYICGIHKLPRLRKKHHYIGFQMYFPDEESKRRTHHMVVNICRPPRDVPARQIFEPALSNPGEACYIYRNVPGRDLRFPTQYCNEIIHIWAIGERHFFLPDHVGIPIGESEDEYYLIQMHYDNPEQRPGIRVAARLDFFYTDRLRPNDGGMTAVQHEQPAPPEAILVPPYETDHRIMAHCGSDCTEKMLPPGGIKITSVLQHSHNAGIAMRFRHVRGGRELPWIIYDDNYDNYFQQTRNLREDVRVLPGDHLSIECHYTTNGTSLQSGFKTTHEMCNAMAIYYPRFQGPNICNSGLESPEARRRFLAGAMNVTWVQEDLLEWVVQTPARLRGLRVTEVSDRLVDWTPEKRRELIRLLHQKATQVGRCLTDISELTLDEYFRLPPRPLGVQRQGPLDSEEGYIGPVRYPFEAVPYVEPEDMYGTCRRRNRNNKYY